MVQKIERAAVDHPILGGEKSMRARIAAFQDALKDHSKTIGVPAPTEHNIIEHIVRNHAGEFEIVEPPETEG